MNKTIILVYPKCGSEAPGMSLHAPVSVLSLAAELPAFDVHIFDQRVDPPEKFIRLLEKKPLCVGFSIMTGKQIGHALQLAAICKDRGLTTVFGGVHATIMPEQTQVDPRVDFVVKGEGEKMFRDYVGIMQRNPKTIIDWKLLISHLPTFLNHLKPLPYHLVNVENYVHNAALEGRSLPFLFSRGCPHHCTFCCNPVISGGKWRSMSVDVAVERLRGLVERYRLDGIFFMDENLTAKPDVINELAAKINGDFKWYAQSRVDSLLRLDLDYLESMGAVRFGCGLESGSPRILKEIKKGETVEQYIELNNRLAKTNIDVWYNYMMGFPGETLEDLMFTIDLALKMLDDNPRAYNNTFYLLTPYPGSEIGNQLMSEWPDTLEGWSEFGRHNYDANWHTDPSLDLYRKVGFSSKFVGRRLLKHFGYLKELNDFTDKMTRMWRNLDFVDVKWPRLTVQGNAILSQLFGENAY